MFDTLVQIAGSLWSAAGWLLQWSLAFINNSSNVIAACAFWIAWQESRRGSTAMVRVTKSSFSFHRTLKGDNHIFSIRLKNRGISLHDVTVNLVMKSPTGDLGQMSFALHAEPEMKIVRAGEFARGMVAEFVFLIPHLGSHDISVFKMVTDPEPTTYAIDVRSQGFTAVEVRPRSRLLQWPRNVWNRAAYFINDLFGHQTRTTRTGRTENVFVQYLPTFDADFDWAASQLVKELKRTVAKAEATTAQQEQAAE